MPLSMLSMYCKDENLTGTAWIAGMGQESRYGIMRSADLNDLGLYQDISSATVYSSPSVDANLILFGSPFPFIPFPDFSGSYLQMTNLKNAATQFTVNRMSDYGFNDKATSLFAVATNRGLEFRFSFRDLFLSKWNTIIDSKLTGGAKRNGDPVLTWEMWPQGISYLDSSQIYLKIYQDLTIEIHCWPDYDANITYHIYLYLDSNGHLNGYVARWSYWIEGGVKADDIEDQLRPAVIDGMSTIDTELAKQLGQYSGIKFNDLYYLPGNQVTSLGTGVAAGSTYSDVTIVVEL